MSEEVHIRDPYRPPRGYEKPGLALSRGVNEDNPESDEEQETSFIRDIGMALKGHPFVEAAKDGLGVQYRYMHENMDFYIHVVRHTKPDGSVVRIAQFWEKA